MCRLEERVCIKGWRDAKVLVAYGRSGFLLSPSSPSHLTTPPHHPTSSPPTSPPPSHHPSQTLLTSPSHVTNSATTQPLLTSPPSHRYSSPPRLTEPYSPPHVTTTPLLITSRFPSSPSVRCIYLQRQSAPLVLGKRSGRVLRSHLCVSCVVKPDCSLVFLRLSAWTAQLCAMW